MLRGKQVEKGRILALLLIATFWLASCAGDERVELDPSNVIAAADSAGKVLSGELTIRRDSANVPSIYFDTLYRYYAGARLLEREKRLDADSLVRVGVLAIDNVKDASLRKNGRRSLYAFLSRDSLRVARRDSLSIALRRTLEKMLDSTSLTSGARDQLVSDLTAKHRFEPEWRTTLDSLARSTVLTEVDILYFLDTVNRRVRIEDVLKFNEANDLAQYQAFTARLSQLASAQQDLVDRITFGVPLTAQDTVRQKADSVAAKSQQPPQTWPGAVRIQ
jgi:hypothetical protein